MKFFFVFIFLLLASVGTASAAFPNFDIGFLSPSYTALTGNTAIADYINNFYSFALGISGALAMGMVVYGGIRYATSAGRPDAQNDAKDAIYSALFGIVLLFGSYLILRTVNPRIITLSTSTSANNPSECPVAGQVYCRASNPALNKCRPQCGVNGIDPVTKQKMIFTEDCNGCTFANITCKPNTTATSSCPGLIILTQELSALPNRPVTGFAPNWGETIAQARVWPNIKGGIYQPPNGSSEYYESEIVWKFSKVWTYPYYQAGDTDKDPAKCIIYAIKEPEGGALLNLNNSCSGSTTGYCLKYDPVNKIDLSPEIKPC